MFNSPGVAGAVLKTPSSFIQWSFSSKSSKHDNSQTVRARKLKFWENVHPPHVSHFMCHESSVTCQVPGVTCQVSHFTCNSQTVRAGKLTFWEKVHLLPPVICHGSCVTCHVSRVTQLLYFFLTFFFFSFYFLKGGGGSRWRVYYHQGIPRLVLKLFGLFLSLFNSKSPNTYFFLLTVYIPICWYHVQNCKENNIFCLKKHKS